MVEEVPGMMLAGSTAEVAADLPRSEETLQLGSDGGLFVKV